MARVLKVSASGYYAWRSRPVSARATADAGLTRHIRTIHAGSHGAYGAPRVHAELKADGLSVGREADCSADASGRDRGRQAGAEARRSRRDRRQTVIPPAISSAATSWPSGEERAVGGRHHLPAHVGRLCLPCGRSRRLVAPDRRMGLIGRSGRPASCSTLSTWRSWPESPTTSSIIIRPRFAIHVGRFRRPLQGSRRSSIDRLGRRRLRQCDVREFLRHPRVRAARPASLSISHRGSDGGLFSSSKASTIPHAATRPWAIFRPSNTRKGHTMAQASPPKSQPVHQSGATPAIP